MLVFGGAFFDEHPNPPVGRFSKKIAHFEISKIWKVFWGPSTYVLNIQGHLLRRYVGTPPKLTKNSKEVFGCLVLGVFFKMFRLVGCFASKKEHPRHSTLAMGLP